MAEKRKLKKELGVFSATSVVVGCVIGAGVFFKPYAIYQATGGAPGMGMLAWIIGGLASIFAALTFAEVAVLIPKTGGMVAYLGEVFGERIGFLAGWMQVVIFYPAFLAGYGVKVGEELSKYIGAQFELPIAMAVILIMVALNTLGNKTTGRIQVVSTVCKLVPLVLLMIFGFVLGSGDNPIFTPLVAEGKSAPAVLGSTLLAVLFAFEGWTNVGAIAGEMKNPGRDLPRAIVGGVSIIMLVYFVINMAYLWVLPADELTPGLLSRRRCGWRGGDYDRLRPERRSLGHCQRLLFPRGGHGLRRHPCCLRRHRQPRPPGVCEHDRRILRHHSDLHSHGPVHLRLRRAGDRRRFRRAGKRRGSHCLGL